MEGPGAEEVPQVKVWAPLLQDFVTSTLDVMFEDRGYAEDRGYVRLFSLLAMIAAKNAGV